MVFGSKHTNGLQFKTISGSLTFELLWQTWAFIIISPELFVKWYPDTMEEDKQGWEKSGVPRVHKLNVDGQDRHPWEGNI